MAEARAGRRNTDEVAEIELLEHDGQYLKWDFQQASYAGP
jgi:hypothetical protein